MDWTPYLRKDGKLNIRKIKILLGDPNYIKLQQIFHWTSSVSELYYCYKNNVIEQPKCYCGYHLKFIVNKRKYNIYCSNKCSNNSIFKKEEFTNICLKKYGVDNPIKSNILKKKVRQTTLQKYGVENVSQSEFIKDKIKLIKKNRYGSENYNNIEKNKQTVLEKYGVENIKQIHIPKETLAKMHDKEWLIEQHHALKKSIKQIAKELKINDSNLGSIFKKLNIEITQTGTSMQEKEIYEYIKSILPSDIEIITNDRTVISPFELDIYIPSKKIAIEFNGLYWHSYDHVETMEEKNKHVYKNNLCEQHGIQLISIFENEWINKNDIVKSILCSKLGEKQTKIFARKCVVKEVSKSDSKKFIDLTHIQGYVGCTISLGLFYNDELVSIMTFGKSRFNKKYEYEILRFSNKLYTQVIGGAGKIFSYFIKSYNPKSIVSYADRRYSVGKMYSAIGFTIDNMSKPNYFYFKPGEIDLYNRITFQKHKLSNKLEIFDEKLTESQNMFNNGFRRIWDCGNIVFGYNIE